MVWTIFIALSSALSVSSSRFTYFAQQEIFYQADADNVIPAKKGLQL